MDLVCFSETLDKNGLFHTLRTLGAELITPLSAISTARINGFDLLAHAQDHVLDGVKVACFTHPAAANTPAR